MAASPAPGFKLKHPNGAAYTRSPPEHEPAGASRSSDGRAAGKPVLFGSRPVVMLYGCPLLATKKELSASLHLSGIAAPRTAVCLVSPQLAGPHSACRLYGSAGRPSLLSLAYESL